MIVLPKAITRLAEKKVLLGTYFKERTGGIIYHLRATVPESLEDRSSTRAKWWDEAFEPWSDRSASFQYRMSMAFLMLKLMCCSYYVPQLAVLILTS